MEGLEKVATAAQALLECGGWRYNNQLPPDPADPRTNYFGVEGKFARQLSDALVGVSRIPRADHYGDWE